MILDSFTKVFSGPTTKNICETAADAAYNSAIKKGLSENDASDIYNDTLKACEAQLKETGFD